MDKTKKYAAEIGKFITGYLIPRVGADILKIETLPDGYVNVTERVGTKPNVQVDIVYSRWKPQNAHALVAKSFPEFEPFLEGKIDGFLELLESFGENFPEINLRPAADKRRVIFDPYGNEKMRILTDPVTAVEKLKNIEKLEISHFSAYQTQNVDLDFADKYA